MMRIILGVIVIAVVGLMAYVRLAPTDTDAVHVQADPRSPGDYPAAGGFLAVRQITAAPDDILRAVQRVAEATDRTGVLSGSVDEGMITFVTRSRLWGFPDFTTVSIIAPQTVENDGPLLMIDGRLRFGQADLDVNKKRVQKWLAALGPLIVPLNADTSAQ